MATGIPTDPKSLRSSSAGRVGGLPAKNLISRIRSQNEFERTRISEPFSGKRDSNSKLPPL